MSEVIAEPKPKPLTPTSAIDLYLQVRSGMAEVKNAYDWYNKIIESITIGTALLSNGNIELINRANRILTDKSTFLYRQNLNWMADKKVYSISTGEEDTGKVTVLPEQVKDAGDNFVNQLASAKIHILKPLDTEIFAALVQHGPIQEQTLDARNLSADLINKIKETPNMEKPKKKKTKG